MENWESPDGSCAAAWVAHDSGLTYAHAEPSVLALFSGRPFLWNSEQQADGRGPAEASWFASPPSDWLERIDGRFASVRWTGGGLELVTDAMGAYPVYEAVAGDTRWFSNSAAALRGLTGNAGYRADSLAGLIGGGWPLDGHPMWDGISRVEPGCALTLTATEETSRRLLPAEELAALPGNGLDADGASERLVACVGALADWPGRPSVVPVTGGRDSRVVLSAALRALFEFDAKTGGAPADPDVVTAAELCAAAGIPHSRLGADPHGSRETDHRRAARIVRLLAGGTASLADAAGFPLGPRGGVLPLWHSGQGGEIGRAYYGSGAGADASAFEERLYTAFTARRPHRPDLLSDDGRELVTASLRAWIKRQLAAGVVAADIPDMFYVDRRMSTWAAPTHGAVEYVRDTTSPLWSRRLLADLLGPPAPEREREAYHRSMLARLAPQLAEVPYAGAKKSIAGKVFAELRRRIPRPRPPAHPFARVIADVREQALSQASHPAWDVIERSRAESLLARPASSLDEMSRYHVWRLATVFVE